MFLHLIWDLDDDPQGNVQHIAEHGITKAEVVEVQPAGDPRGKSVKRPPGGYWRYQFRADDPRGVRRNR